MTARPRTARDVMQTGVITVGPDMPLTKLCQLFFDESIHAAPVIDETDQLLGIVSMSDVVRAVQQESDSAQEGTRGYAWLNEIHGPDWMLDPTQLPERLEELLVADVMQPTVVSVAEDASIAEIARAMTSNRIHRVVVLRDGGLAGIVSSLDLVRLLEA